jgi:hypothetical protein
MQPQPNVGGQNADLATWVRNYVHYDNLAGNYSKQATGARKLRDEFESKIITNLRANSMDNAIIQISGARLQVAEDKTAPSMTLPRLESYLHKYFAGKGNGIDETEGILRFIRMQRANDTQPIARLKRTTATPPVPPPPAPSQPPSLK